MFSKFSGKFDFFVFNILGALVGLDRGSKYCTIEIRDRESVYALATATPADASMTSSAAVAEGFRFWFGVSSCRSSSCSSSSSGIGSIESCEVTILMGSFARSQSHRAK